MSVIWAEIESVNNSLSSLKSPGRKLESPETFLKKKSHPDGDGFLFNILMLTANSLFF